MSKVFTAKNSSVIDQVAYSGGKLTVKFKGNENLYEYYFVPESVFTKLKKAESVGKTFAKIVKGQYPETKLEPK